MTSMILWHVRTRLNVLKLQLINAQGNKNCVTIDTCDECSVRIVYYCEVVEGF